MITISLCMIVRDEEGTIARCLDSVEDIVDEIIVVDTGSVDKTKEIVKQYTSSIFDFQWIDDFSVARNFSFSKATKDYTLWLDADDVLLEEDRNKLKMLKVALDPSVDVVMMKYNLGSDQRGRASCSYYRERLLKTSKNFKWEDPIHEFITPTGKIIKVDVAVTHKKIKEKSTRNLNVFKKMIEQGKELSHRNYFYYARELYAHKQLDEARIYFEKFLNQEGGLFSNYIDACIELSRIHSKKNDRLSSIRTLLRCFEFGVPRAEICCEIGGQFKELGNLETAISWYEIATSLTPPSNTVGAVVIDCYNYIPYVEISICNYKMGKIQEALTYNEKAAEYKPDSNVVINNRNYFQELLKNKKQ